MPDAPHSPPPYPLPLIEFRVLDHNAVAMGTDLGDLMKNAGRAVADAVRARWPAARRAVVACGPGNNGGDGFVAARLLREAGLAVDVVLAAEPRSALAQRSRERWGGAVHDAEALPGLLSAGALAEDEADGAAESPDGDAAAAEPEGDGAAFGAAAAGDTVAIDALLGSGLRGALREPYATLAAMLNTHPAVLSVDVPTGLGLHGAVVPGATVTFHALKEGMTPETCGDIEVADIGFPPEAQRFTGPGEVQLLPPLPPDARKGDGGVVVIVGGGPYTGAPALAARAAYRFGADLVYLLVPESAAAMVAGFAPEFMVSWLPGAFFGPEHIDMVLGFAERADALLVGPGLGRHPHTQAAVTQLVMRWRKPRILDADALYGLPPDVARGTLLTPHAGELARLAQAAGTPPDDPPALAARLGCTLLAKGPVDVITNGSQTCENRTGHVRMRVGGTGDVLAGAVAAAAARGLMPFQTARVAAWAVGRAGELAAQDFGDGFLAGEVADRLPLALRQARESA